MGFIALAVAAYAAFSTALAVWLGDKLRDSRVAQEDAADLADREFWAEIGMLPTTPVSFATHSDQAMYAARSDADTGVKS